MGIPKAWVKSPDDAKHAATESELSKDAVVRFLDASGTPGRHLQRSIRGPKPSGLLGSTLMEEGDLPKVVSILAERRKSPLKRYKEQRQSEPDQV